MKDSLKYIYTIAFLLVATLAFMVARPFIGAVFAGIIIAYTFFPLHNFAQKYIASKKVCAWMLSIIVVLSFVIPSVVLIQHTQVQVESFYERSQEFLQQDYMIPCEEESLTCYLLYNIENSMASPAIKSLAVDAIGKFTTYLISDASNFILSLPSIFLNAFVTIFVTFYLFMDGEAVAKRTKSLLPVRKKHRRAISQRLNEIAHGVIYGSIAVALIQGALGAIGYWILGIEAPLLWGAIMAIFAVMPVVGTAAIWGPTAAFMLISGLVTENPSLVTKAITLTFYGVFVISGVDNIVKPKIVGAKAKIHPVSVLIGVLGGISVFGFIGFIIGPIILALFEALLCIYEKEQAHAR